MLPMKGNRQPPRVTCSAVSEWLMNTPWPSQDEAERGSAAVELLTRPRSSGDEASVV
jgi:hypothetical protein